MQSHRFWFRPKNYGYGFFPISWEGWLMTLGMFVTVLVLAYLDGFFTPSGPSLRDALHFLWQLGVTIAMFWLFAIPKTDGEVHWQWGGPLIPTASTAKRVVRPAKAARLVAVRTTRKK